MSPAFPEPAIAFGRPGIEPRWTRASKDAVGAAHGAASHVWFTVSAGIVNEIYHPTIDRPQVRDLQLLVTDGETFFHDERRDLTSAITPIDGHALGYRVTNTDPGGRYVIHKELIAHPTQSAVLLRTWLEIEPEWQGKLRVFVLCAPHLEIGGYGNNGAVVESNGRRVLTAHRNGMWLALGADRPFVETSVGYVGSSDGWQDLADNFRMDWHFDQAPDGNIALTGEIDLTVETEFTVAVAFGDHQHAALTTLFQSLGHDFDHFRDEFIDGWRTACDGLVDLSAASGDGGALYRTSASLLLSHEDKRYPGALIASLSIPWGDEKGDHELGGYHLVWTRDMVNSATGILATGNTEAPLRSLIYLATTQYPSGGFPQNFWIDGTPYWHGVQLDEVAFPIVLAWRLEHADGVESFDAYPMVRAGAGYLIRNGPATPQERWEEASGFSPSTLASNVAALVCAADMARRRADQRLAAFLEDYADYLEARIEQWTVTTVGTLHPDVPEHYIRILPVDVTDPFAAEDPDDATLVLANQAPDGPHAHPARNVVDAGFLELVRYGIRPPGDSLVEQSLAVVDHCLRFDSPSGTAWYRYNHDGYGQRDDGSGYHDWGVGRPWPLLTGERAHYEFAAGRDPRPLITSIERFANGVGLLPEQVWDRNAIPERGLEPGRPTGAAMPLMWAHAEYIKLLRSVTDDAVFDHLGIVQDRYRRGSGSGVRLEIWKPNRRVTSMRHDQTLRILAPQPFTAYVSEDGGHTARPITAEDSGVAVWFVDVEPAPTTTAVVFDLDADDGGWDGGRQIVEIRS